MRLLPHTLHVPRKTVICHEAVRPVVAVWRKGMHGPLSWSEKLCRSTVFESEQEAFYVESAAISRQTVVAAGDSVAGYDDRERICAHCVCHSSDSCATTYRSGQTCVAHGGTVADVLQCGPYLLLERCATEKQGQIEPAATAREILVELCGSRSVRVARTFLEQCSECATQAAVGGGAVSAFEPVAHAQPSVIRTQQQRGAWSVIERSDYHHVRKMFSACPVQFSCRMQAVCCVMYRFHVICRKDCPAGCRVRVTHPRISPRVCLPDLSVFW